MTTATSDSVIALSVEAGPAECAVLASGYRTGPGHDCVNTPTHVGGAPGTAALFRVCSAHAHLVIDAWLMTEHDH